MTVLKKIEVDEGSFGHPDETVETIVKLAGGRIRIESGSAASNGKYDLAREAEIIADYKAKGFLEVA